MHLTDQELDALQALAGLKLEPAERETLRGHLSRILTYVHQLEAIDTEGIEPTTHGEEHPTPLRDDEPKPCLGQKDALREAPAARDGFFEVPVVLGGPS
jgi:aspartyl-tRNA(Asn)/glutamyl-tRNA(Gln) amidotransferase subunit C